MPRQLEQDRKHVADCLELFKAVDETRLLP